MDLAMPGKLLDIMILEVFSNLSYSMIPLHLGWQRQHDTLLLLIKDSFLLSQRLYSVQLLLLVLNIVCVCVLRECIRKEITLLEMTDYFDP